jgi:hypothetical protein
MSVDAPTTSGAPGRGVVFIFVSFFDLCLVDDSISLALWPCPREEMVRPGRPPHSARGGGCPVPLPWQGSALRRR